MTVATDFAAYGAATKRIQVTSTSTLLTGATGLLAEAIPTSCRHIALIPEASGVHFNFGTASADTALMPLGGMIFNAHAAPSLVAMQLYAAASTYVHVIMGGDELRVLLGASLATGDIEIGAVEIKDPDGTDRLGVYVEDTAHTTADTGLVPLAVRTDTRASLCDTTGDYVPLQTTANGDLRVRDDDAIGILGATTDEPLAAETAEGATARTLVSLGKREVNKLIDIKALLVKGAAAAASSLSTTIATDDAHFGAVGAASDVDGVLHGQLRYVGEQLASQLTALGYSADRFETTVTSADASGGVAFSLAQADKKIALASVLISCGGPMTVTLEDADGNDKLVAYCGTTGGVSHTFPPNAPRRIDTANKDLKLTTSASGNVSVTVTGYYYA